MKNNTGISQVDEPVWLVETKPSQEVPWSRISKGRISESSTAQVEESCGEDCYY